MLTRVLGIPVAMRATEGPNQNLVLIEAGEVQLGFVTMGVALQGWNGVGDWTQGRQYRAARAMFPMYDTPFHFVVLQDSPVRSLPTWAASGSGSARKAAPRAPTSRLPEALGIEAPLVHGTLGGARGAAGRAAPRRAGGSRRRAVPRRGGARRQEAGPLCPAHAGADHGAAPGHPRARRVGDPARHLPVAEPGYETVGLYNFAVAHKDLPADLVYRIVDAVFDHHEEMLEIHRPRRPPSPATSSTTPSCPTMTALSAITATPPVRRPRRGLTSMAHRAPSTGMRLVSASPTVERRHQSHDAAAHRRSQAAPGGK